ncbi:hypothetical protein GCM10027053_48030 [Intrasporangium mesophilum]
MSRKFRAEPPLARRSKNVELGDLTEWAHLGRLAELGPRKAVRLGVGMERVLAIVGKRGSGKSFTLGSVLESLSTTEPATTIGSISKERGVLLFDTLNIFQWMGRAVADDTPSAHIAEQARALRAWSLDTVPIDVDLWVPSGYEDRLHQAALPFRIRTSDMTAGDWTALMGLDAVQDVMGQLVTAVLDKVVRRGWTKADGTAIAAQPDYAISNLLECLAEDPDLQADYMPGSIRAIRQRLTSYDASPLFASTGTTLAELVQPGRLSALLLSGVPDDVRMVCIFLTIRKLLQARADASEAAKSIRLGALDAEHAAKARATVLAAPPKSWVVIDEAQNVFPSERQTAASATLLRFVREGRNFGLSLAFTTQQPTALDPRIMAQVDTMLVHTLTVQKDIAAVLSNLKSKEPVRIELNSRPLSTADAIRDLDVGQCLVSSVDADRAFFMDVRPRVSVHGGFEG